MLMFTSFTLFSVPRNENAKPIPSSGMARQPYLAFVMSEEEYVIWPRANIEECRHVISHKYRPINNLKWEVYCRYEAYGPKHSGTFSNSVIMIIRSANYSVIFCSKI